ncbi:BatA domain-containing protein [Erythrobacter sp. NE805]|uniref:BatA domain-containing protein n=1 Tax=Erythrobacter sp. NE805 TaxID=3389875 RepID=UPI00396B133A
MTPLLLAPLGLAALAALAVPLVIHLHRRTEEVPVDFAALRWLDALPRPRSKLRFDEWVLLALRLLLMALLALLLARPAVLGSEGDTPHFLAAPGVDPAAARAAVGPEAELRWIAPGFPEVGAADPPPRSQVSSLIRQFDAELPSGAPLTVLVPPVLSGVDAEPLRLTRKVAWRVVAAGNPDVEPEPPPSPALAVRHPPGGEASLRYFRAAASAWSDAPRFEARTDDALPPTETVLVWLVPGPLPQAVTDWVSKGGTALLGKGAEVAMPAATGALWRDGVGETLVEGAPLGAGRLLRFTHPLAPAAMPELLAPDFAARLREVVSSPPPPPARVASTAFVPKAGIEPYPLPPRELASWLGVLIALGFLAERLLATRARRFAA